MRAAGCRAVALPLAPSPRDPILFPLNLSSFLMTGCEDRLLTGSSCPGDVGQGWREEAEAVVHEIRDFVNQVSISRDLPCNQSAVFLNLETREAVRLTIQLSASGFRVCGHSFDCIQEPTAKCFESVNALLDSISPGYRKEFSSSLARRLEQLAHEKSSGNEEFN